MSTKKTASKRKPKERLFYRVDCAGLWVYLKRGSEEILINPYAIHGEHAEFLKLELDAE